MSLKIPLLSMLQQFDLDSIGHACNVFLANQSVRYICILNRMGNLLYEKEQPGRNLLLSNKESRSLYIKSVLGILFEKDFDSQIGMLRYNVSHRTKVDLIAVPIYDFIILISMEPKQNSGVIAQSAIEIFEKIFKKQ